MQVFRFKNEDFSQKQNQYNIYDGKNIFLTEKLFLEPLYKKIELPSSELNNILPYYSYNSIKSSLECPKLELYCAKCKIKRVFKFLVADPKLVVGECVPVPIGSIIDTLPRQKSMSKKDKFMKETDYFYLYALSDCGHHIVINFKVLDENSVMKIGQYPSIYDLNENINNKEFLKLLENEYASYYKSACSLHSFNTNIGAMTYLRRIFEKILIDTFNENESDYGIEEFKKMRIEDKVKNLKTHLPELIFEQGFCQIYSLISDGVHNLTEDECNENFDLLKCAIEEILIEKLNKIEEKERKEDLKRRLQNIK
ncbi:MAG: hypothetical protein PHI05_00085 [Bacilli bacterium]|nr:hypothetical protein [Bacilli bacterium]